MSKEQINVENKSARQEAKSFVGSGNLRSALQNCGYSVSEEAIDKIVDACCFVFKV